MQRQLIELEPEEVEIVLSALEAYAKFRKGARGDTPAANMARRLLSRAEDIAVQIRRGQIA